jgi:hypothetical protein
MLLDIAGNQLHLEIVGILLGNFVDTRKDRLQIVQVGNAFHLLIQAVQLV